MKPIPSSHQKVKQKPHAFDIIEKINNSAQLEYVVY